MSDTERRLKLARAEQTEMQSARDDAAARLADLRTRAGLEHLTLDELARGKVPTIAGAVEALREIERRCRDKAVEVQSMEADLRNERAREAASVYLAKLGTLIESLKSLDDDLQEMKDLRTDLLRLEPFTKVPDVARLCDSVDELRKRYDVARGARYSMEREAPRVAMVRVDGRDVPRAEYESRPKTVSRSESIKALFGRSG